VGLAFALAFETVFTLGLGLALALRLGVAFAFAFDFALRVGACFAAVFRRTPVLGPLARFFFRAMLSASGDCLPARCPSIGDRRRP
jgi:hypothetical protein